jgi:hypothetical protein
LAVIKVIGGNHIIMSILTRKRHALSAIRGRRTYYTNSVKTYGRIYLYLFIKIQNIHLLQRPVVRNWYKEDYYYEDK